MRVYVHILLSYLYVGMYLVRKTKKVKDSIALAYLFLIVQVLCIYRTNSGHSRAMLSVSVFLLLFLSFIINMFGLHRWLAL